MVRTASVMRRMTDVSDQDIAEALSISPEQVVAYIEEAEQGLALTFGASGYQDTMEEVLDSFLTLPNDTDLVSKIMEKIREPSSALLERSVSYTPLSPG